MKITAIAVYDSSFKQIKTVQKTTAGFFIFNPIKNFEETIKPKLDLTLADGEIYNHEENREFFYIKRSGDFFYLIISERSLDKAEKVYLFVNIQHAHLREKTVNTTLQNILDNPLNYIARDILVKTVREGTDELFVQTKELVNKVVERGQLIENLQDKTIKLVDDAEKFEQASKKLNKCCTWW